MAGCCARLVTSSGIVIGFTIFGSDPPVQAGQRTVGDFTYIEASDDFDDSDRSTVITMAEGSDGGALFWACRSDGLNAILNVGKYYGGDEDDDILVRYRFDQNEAQGPEYWRLFPGQNEMVYQRMDKVADFTSQAIMADTVIVEATDPLDSESKRFRFGLVGLEEILDLLSCAVDPPQGS